MLSVLCHGHRESSLLLLFSSLLLSSLELSDTKVYEPSIRARLGTAAHFCEVVVLKLRTVPIGLMWHTLVRFSGFRFRVSG